MGLTVKAIIELLNELKINQSSIDWLEDLPEKIYYDVFEGKHKDLGTGLDVDKHRWYETSIDVIGIADGIMGVRIISDIFSESTTVEDCYNTLQFFEMEEVKVITYKRK